MGDPSFLIVVAKNLVLNWDALSRAAQRRILAELNSYRGGELETLPPTFEELMKVFDHRKFFGYLVPPIANILTEWLPVFPETGIALFIHCGGPVAFVFDPSAERHQIMHHQGHPTGDDLDPYQCQELVRAAAVTFEADSETEAKAQEQEETPESEFYSDVVLQLQALESAQQQIRLLQRQGLRIQPPASRAELDMINDIMRLGPWRMVR